jgi:hypothetical protein
MAVTRLPVREDRSLGELLGELADDLTLLMRQEVQLAKAEMTAKLNRATRDLVSVGTGAIVAWIAGLAFTAFLILGLTALGVAAWLSALIVAVVFGVAGFVMLQRGLADLKRVEATPRRTVETLKDDVQWAKEQRR